MDAFTQEMQQKLLQEREELVKKLNSEGNNFAEEAQLSSGKDSSDLASDDAAYRKMEALNAMDAQRLKAIEGALKRIGEGRYGICLQCGKRIPEGRLRAIPSAVLCVECKSQNEKMG
ncbi:MAG TPA: TraR/DksA C4-type zinc finger protein [Candidatus Ornithospirochaeta avicola]|uniref:TraR/DksA C4-type zinc finger protein n=1 Tax=Candidatus Ornithospirochaeta avicola TaxID=2840896 RepID=A0A9D1TN84_9SPIO|nr:TraR/DksA C4-type zinc finger protein [Candidatus Ornithospirochaeta avicola]